MKILSIHWGLSLGGVAKYVATLERIRERGAFNIRSLCLMPAGRVVDEKALAALDSLIVPVRSMADMSWVPQVRRIVAQEAPDCVLSHGFNGHLVSLIGCAFRAPSIKRLATYHGSYHATTTARRMVEPLYNGFTHWYMRSRADGVLNVAQYCADFLQDRGVPHQKLAVVHNGIPDYQAADGRRATIREEWGFNDEHVLIGVASRLDPVKGLEYLITAFAELSARFPSARLVLMGDGTVRNALENQASALGVRERVLFTGMLTDVPDCLSALDVFALPSLAEYHSIGLLEAMRAKLPIVATDVGGNIESVRDGREGLIVPSANAGALSAALTRLLSDAELRASLSAAARQRFAIEFTEEAMLDKTARWFERLCGETA